MRIFLHYSFRASASSTWQTRAPPFSTWINSLRTEPTTSSCSLWPPASYPRPATERGPIRSTTFIPWRLASPTSSIKQRWSPTTSASSAFSGVTIPPTAIFEILSHLTHGLHTEPLSSPATTWPTVLHGFPTSSCPLYTQQRWRWWRASTSTTPATCSTSTSPNLYFFRFSTASSSSLQWLSSTCCFLRRWQRCTVGPDSTGEEATKCTNNFLLT